MYEMLALLLVEEFGIAEEVVQPHAKARDIELDSLSLAELSVMITQRTGMQIDEDAVSLDSTLQEIAEQFKPAEEAHSRP